MATGAANRRLTLLGYGACIAAASLWGTGFYFSRLALNEMSVEYMVLYRILFACLGVLPVALRQPVALQRRRSCGRCCSRRPSAFPSRA